jgi:hypothetical protein
MQVATQTATVAVSKRTIWAGRILSGLVIAFLLMDAIMKFVIPPAVVKGMADAGWPLHFSVPLGIILLSCVILYTIPRTSVLGAILLTGYLGGAVASNMRLELPLFSHVLFPVYVGVLAWGGLFFREPRVRDLIPLKR